MLIKTQLNNAVFTLTETCIMNSNTPCIQTPPECLKTEIIVFRCPDGVSENGVLRNYRRQD